MSFVHKRPRELQQEDRWFKIFTPKQAIVASICGVIVIISSSLLSKVLSFFPVLAIEVMFIITCGFGIFSKLPPENYLNGGGQNAVLVLLRRLYRTSRKVVYVKCYDEEVTGEWEK